MADDRIAAFRTASEFAESAAGFAGQLCVLARYDMPTAAVKQIATLRAEWNQHFSVIDSNRDDLSGVADDLIEHAGRTYPNAHKAALDLARRILSEVECALLVSGVIDKSAVGVTPELPISDPSVIEVNWPVVRDAILRFASEMHRWDPTFDREFDAAWVQTLVARERIKTLERLSLRAERTGVGSGSTEDSPDTNTNANSERPTYLIAEMCKELDLSSATLNKYAKQACVPTPRRGQRDFRYTEAQRQSIYQAIIDTSSDAKLVERSRELIEKKSKARN